MSGKGSSGGGTGLSKEDTKTEHPLQAILLCDAWGEEQRWGPLVRRKRTDDEEYEDLPVGGEQRPWCLLPLLDTPLLAWTLESLASAGVEQIFVFVREGVEEVRAWLATSYYMQAFSPLQIILRPTKAATPGDVLREVDSLQILAPADFLVVQAGYVGSIDLAQKVKEFTERRTTDPTLTMSCVVAPVESRTSSTFAVHAVSSDAQLFHYEQSALFPSLKHARLPREALESGKDLHIRSDLDSVGVAICSIEVAPLFTENFDYQFFYPDFVNGLLTSDLLGKTICCTIVGEDEASKSPVTSRKAAAWAGAVGNTKSYDAISKAILSRKAYPLAPDESMPEDGVRYEQRRGRVYYGKDLDLSRSCTITSTSLLGSLVSIGDNSSVSRSVLSASVSIGSSCTVSESYLFAGSSIGDNCTIANSIIGEGVKVEAGSTVIGGSLVAAGCVLGSRTQLDGSRVSLEEPLEDVGDTGSLGPNSTGYLWPSEAQLLEEDYDSDEDPVDSRNYDVTRLGAALSRMALGDSETSSLSSLSRASSTTSLSTAASLSASTYATDDPPAIQGLESLQPADAQSDFLSECTQSLDRSFAENHTVENAAIELKTLRMASNVPLGQVRELVVPYILARCGPNGTNAAPVLERWGGLIANLTGDQEDAMEHCLLVAQGWVAEQAGVNGTVDVRFFLRVLKGFYENDVVTDDAAFAWYKSVAARTTGGDKGKQLWAGSKPFLEAIAADSDDEDEDEDEHDEDEDSE